jgi:hypothetical protein
MRVQNLLEELADLDIQLRADGDYLRYEGPEEAITPELLNRLRQHKAELIKILADEKRCRVHLMQLDPSVHQLAVAGWNPKGRCGKTIYQSPRNGFWYSQEMALVLLRQQNDDRGRGRIANGSMRSY